MTYRLEGAASGTAQPPELHEPSKGEEVHHLEMRVVATEEQALQPLRVPEYFHRNALSFPFKEVDKAVYRCGNRSVNQWGQLLLIQRSASRRSKRPQTWP